MRQIPLCTARQKEHRRVRRQRRVDHRASAGQSADGGGLPGAGRLFPAIVARFPAERSEDALGSVRAPSVKDRAQLGYPGFEALTIHVDHDERLAAVERVMIRGPCYRDVQPPGAPLPLASPT